MTSTSLTSANYKAVAGDTEFGHDGLLLEIAAAMNKLLFIPEVLVRYRIYSETSHAWTNVLPPPPRQEIFCGTVVSAGYGTEICKWRVVLSQELKPVGLHTSAIWQPAGTTVR